MYKTCKIDQGTVTLKEIAKHFDLEFFDFMVEIYSSYALKISSFFSAKNCKYASRSSFPVIYFNVIALLKPCS